MKKHYLLSITLGLFCLTLSAQDISQQRLKEFNLDDKLAIEGYDPVAYFKQNSAVKGKKEFTVYHLGVLYRFANAENKEDFKKDPYRYEPQYGGWCAYAMGAKAEKVSIDPETFKIVNGKLYLFYNRAFNNTLKSWNKDESNLKAKADQSWKKIFTH